MFSVDAVPEGKVPAGLPLVVDRVGVREPVRVRVGGGQRYEYQLVGFDRSPTEGERFGGESDGRDVHRPKVAQVLFQCRRELPGALPQS